jgi:deoxyribodipyrimidine photolyase-related protein
MKTLRLILGDQLSQRISSLRDADQQNDAVLMCEVVNEATYVKHHQKKIAFLFSAMRHFAEELKQEGHRVIYIPLTDPDNTGSFSGEAQRACENERPDRIVVTFPGEYRVLHELEQLESQLGLPVEIRPDDRFIVTREEFSDWAEGRKTLQMEYFYREVRRKHGILMDGDDPEGGEWNYDASNRKPFKGETEIPPPFRVKPDSITKDVMKLVGERFGDHFGDLKPFHFAVTRKDALKALHAFIDERLSNFGDYQDAMVQGEPWMFHAHIGMLLNCGLLDARECVEAAEASYRKRKLPLNSVEGFIRQIIGWREYVRGIYWLKMPEYARANFLEAERPLPGFYWTGETPMNCLKQCVTETKANAYAHHIQRLMVLGNFALLIGVDPAEVNEWYLSVYADAYEWVELPNVTGMTLFADGGVLATKPYAAGGAYINRMSDYCKSCAFKVTVKTGPDACPFNYLYWDFLMRNREKLAGNRRLGMMYRNLERMQKKQKKAVRESADSFLSQLQ